MRLCCTDTLVPGRSYLEKAECLRACGYEGMTIYADYDSWNEEKTKEVMTLKDKTGIQIAEFVFIGPKYGHLSDPDDKARITCIEVCKEAIAIAGEIGALTEVEFDVYRKEGISYDFNEYPYPPEDIVQRYLESMEELLLAAVPTGTQVLLEAVNRYEGLYNNLQEHSLRLIKRLPYDNTGLLSDLFHMMIDEEHICSTLYKCRNYVKHIHLGDTNRRMPGQGMLNWKEIMDTLKAIHYDGFMNLECSIFGDPVTELKRTSSFLKSYM